MGVNLQTRRETNNQRNLENTVHCFKKCTYFNLTKHEQKLRNLSRLLSSDLRQAVNNVQQSNRKKSADINQTDFMTPEQQR